MIQSVMAEAIKNQASDIHLRTGKTPILRVNGNIWFP